MSIENGKERRDAFLSELRELTEKHGVVISGCGCCGSPRLTDLLEKGEGANWDPRRGGSYTCSMGDTEEMGWKNKEEEAT